MPIIQDGDDCIITSNSKGPADKGKIYFGEDKEAFFDEITKEKIDHVDVPTLVTSNNTAYTSTRPIAALVTGEKFMAKMPAANSSGTVTLAPNSLAAKPVLNPSDMSTNIGTQLIASSIYEFVYNSSLSTSGAWVAYGVAPVSVSIPTTSETADGTIPSKALAEIDGSGDLVVATYNSMSVYGCNATGTQKTAAQAITLYLSGPMTCVADLAIPAGRPVKAAYLGKVMRLVTPEIAASALKTNAAAGNFGNQPTNDYIEVLSDSAADTTQTVTIYGTTHGGDVVVKAVMGPLTGVTAVKSVKADWGKILAIVISAAHAGTVTVRKFTGPATITTIATGTLSAGYVAVAETKCFNSIPYLVPGGAVTTQVGLIGTTYNAAELLDSQAQVASTTNQFNYAFRTITHILTGDVATGTTPSVQVGPADDISMMVGRAGYAAVDAADIQVIR